MKKFTYRNTQTNKIVVIEVQYGKEAGRNAFFELITKEKVKYNKYKIWELLSIT